MSGRNRRYTRLLVLLGLLAFGSSATGSFWVVFLHEVDGLPPAAVAALVGAAACAAAFTGGLLASARGFPALFGFGAAVIVGAAVLAAVTARPSERVRLAWDPRRLGRGTCVAYAAQGGIDGVLWTAIPLVTLSFVQGAVELGALFSLFALSGGVFAVFLGRWSDRIRHRRRFIALGAALPIPLAIAVGLAPNLLAFTVANGILSATLAVAPTFITTAGVDRPEAEVGPGM